MTDEAQGQHGSLWRGAAAFAVYIGVPSACAGAADAQHRAIRGNRLLPSAVGPRGHHTLSNLGDQRCSAERDSSKYMDIRRPSVVSFLLAGLPGRTDTRENRPMPRMRKGKVGQ